MLHYEQMQSQHQTEVIEGALRQGPLRSKDLEGFGMSRVALMRLVEQGKLERLGRGLYGLKGMAYDENQQLLEVCQQVPKGVVSLLSALQYHGLTTEAPRAIWLAVPEGSRQPSLTYPPIKVCRYSATSHAAGVQEMKVTGGIIRVYAPAKTVADCFKYRNKIGKDVALVALKDCWNQKLATMNELTQYARICRVLNVMKPHLEILASG